MPNRRTVWATATRGGPKSAAPTSTGRLAPTPAATTTATRLMAPPAALQKLVTHPVWSAAGGAMSLVAVVVAAGVGASLPVLVGAALFGPPLVAVADTVLLFGIQRPDLRPRRQWVHRLDATRLARQGSMFCFLAVAIAVGYESDALVISHALGASAVPQFALPDRILMLAPGAVSLVATSLWPAFAEAMARGDRAWVERTLKRSLALAVGGTAAVSAVIV